MEWCGQEEPKTQDMWLSQFAVLQVPGQAPSPREAEEESQHDILANLLADVTAKLGAQRKCAQTTREKLVSSFFNENL